MVEQWFDGIDRAAIWHRRVAITGLVILAPHVLLSSNPNGTALGGPLGAIGAIGMIALATWAILPRWQSVVPGQFSSNRGCLRSSAVRTGASTISRGPIGRCGSPGASGWRRSSAGCIAERHDSLHAHLIDTSAGGRLTPERVLTPSTVTQAGCRSSCAGRGMLRSFQARLRSAGVPARRIHREYFDWR